MAVFSSTKGQSWGYDLIISITIFIIGIVIIYVYAINFSLNTSSDYKYQAKYISSIILSEGSPEDWTAENFELPGILSNGKINQTKLELFSLLPVEQIKKKTGLKYNFYFFFDGHEGVGLIPQEQKNLFSIERFAIYDNKPVKFTLYIWD